MKMKIYIAMWGDRGYEDEILGAFLEKDQAIKCCKKPCYRGVASWVNVFDGEELLETIEVNR
jgi:hypothetical protein